MESHRTSYRLYVSFLKERYKDLLKVVTTPHNEQFILNRNKGLSYKKLYIDQLDKKTLVPPPNDDCCRSCRTHFLKQRPEIDHEDDLVRGRVFEDHFQEFINSIFQELSFDFECQRADDTEKNMPDLKVIDTKNNTEVFYIEFKTIFKPFIYIGKKIPGAQCYSHSMTLDCDHKLSKQKNLINKKGIKDKTIYLYWYDIPCMKGFFWMTATDVFMHAEDSPVYKRMQQSGDFNEEGRQTGHIEKVYLPLLDMNNFESLFSRLLNIENLEKIL